MISLKCLAILLPLAARLPAGESGPGIDCKLAERYFEEARLLAAKDGGRLWGESLAGPLLFADRQSRQVVANQRDAEGFLQPSDGVFVGRLPESETIANTSTTWAGVKWTMVMWPLPSDPAERGILLMHESWHRIQDRLGLPPSNPPNQHLDRLDGRLWLQLEWRALAKALAATDQARREAVTDALLFRAHRRSLFKNAADEERSLEMHEGMAEYTGVRLCGLAERELPPLAVGKLERRPAQMATFVRSFAYVSGPAYGLLLDAARPGWRKGLKPANDLGVLLREALAIELPPVTPADLDARGRRYQGDQLRAAEQARDEQRQKRLAESRARLVDGPVLVVSLQKMQVSFNPNEVQPLEGLGTVYPTLRVADVWGVLNVSKGALLSADFSKVQVVAPKDPHAVPLAGDGWKLELKEGWKIEPGKRPGDYVLTGPKP
jgi:hypothetical protein